jgi:hypothetical protein
MEPKKNIVQRTGMLSGKQIAMDIDPAMTAHIMSVLTDLYSDSEMAVIRELSTNAWDSHVEAGQTRPIEIRLPNAMNPYYTIRDFGVGLSVDEVERVYSQYGASTKRDSNDFNGMLGLGSKSPLTYTNQFMITARKNGVQIILSVSRMEDGRGGMTVIDTSSTLEPNGVEIQIPVKHGHRFPEKVAQFFKYWPQGTVLVNKQQPQRFEGEEVVPGIFMVPNGKDTIVMGNVAYPALKPLFETQDTDNFGYTRNRNFGVVAFVEIGDVDFTPNRESLKDKDPDTVAKHDEIRATFTKAFAKTIQENIDKAESHQKAVEKYLEYSRIVSGTSIQIDQFTYKGKSIPGKFEQPVEKTTTSPSGVETTVVSNAGFRVLYPNRTRNNLSWTSSIHHDQRTFERVLIITNMPNLDKPTANMRSKVRRYIEDSGKHISTVYFVQKNVFGEWAGDAPVVDDLLDIKTIRLSERKTRGGKYDVIDSNGWNKEQDGLDEKKQIIYYSPAESYYGPYVRAALPKAEIVSIAMNRWDKFKRDYPKATHIRDHMTAMLKEAQDNLTESDKIRLGVDYSEHNILASFKAGQILDPEIDKYVVALHSPESTTQKAYNAVVALVQKTGIRPASIHVGRVLTPYPLVGYNGSRRHTDHMIKYINMIYKENNS